MNANLKPATRIDWPTATAALSLFAILAASAAGRDLPRLRTSDNHRSLVNAEGKPFFWLGDTAWELFHRLNREEAGRYLEDRASRGFTVIQAVALAELDGLNTPNAYGHRPLLDLDPARPDVKDGPDNDYWDFVDAILDEAARRGLYVGFLPTWGSYVTSSAFDGQVNGIFNVTNALAYGQFLGTRYRTRSNLIWILGGDKAPSTPAAVAVWQAMAKGITRGVADREHDDRVLMTYHTSGPGHVSDYIHDEPWLDFTSAQSSHGDLVESWRFIEKHWNRQPIKPVIDLESSYPDALIPAAWLPQSLRAAHLSTKPSTDDHARRAAYWAVFAGAAGHTYGHNSIWQMYAPPHKPILDAKLTWREALDAPSARQMGYLRALMESRPLLNRVPDQALIAGDAGAGAEHTRATRGDGYALVYSPTGRPFRVNLDKLTGQELVAAWFDPRTGTSRVIGQFRREGEREFTPPGESGVGNDWVLILDVVRPRVVIMSDFPPIDVIPGGSGFGPPEKRSDPDDVQSLVRLLLYANDLDVEGLVASSGTLANVADKQGLLDVLDLYDRVDENLRRHDPRYPSADHLRSVTSAGRSSTYARPASEIIGPGMDSEASESIIAAVDRPDPRPLWCCAWGGPRELAQALWKIRETRTPAETAQFVRNIRVYLIALQDGTGQWLLDTFPDLFVIHSAGNWTGMLFDAPGSDSRLADLDWLNRHVRKGHGALGLCYPESGWDPKALGVKEGDSPSFLHLLSGVRGLNDPEQPDQPGWGGCFVRRNPARNHWTDDAAGPSSVWRWREQVQADFAARMDWCLDARIARVSVDTDSYVLNRKDPGSAQSESRVKYAVEALPDTPSGKARQLLLGRSSIIDCVADTIANHSSPHLVKGPATAAAAPHPENAERDPTR